MKKLLFASLLLHLFLLFLEVQWTKNLPNAPVPKVQPTSLWIVDKSVAKQGPTASSHSPKAGTKKVNSNNTKKEAGSVHLKNLGIAPLTSPGTQSVSENPSSGGTGSRHHGKGSGSGDGYDVANRMDLVREGTLYPFFSAIWRRVDMNTTYPKDFVDQGIEGKVSVQIAVDRRGVFTGSIQSVRGPEPMLNAFAVATLVHALREPLAENNWMNEDRILLVFQFEFQLVAMGSVPHDVEPHSKNVLTIRREAHTDGKLNRAIERFFTRYFPPIIPLPGAFFVDFPRLYLFIKDKIHPDPDPDDLRKERLDLLKKDLEQFIHQSGETK